MSHPLAALARSPRPTDIPGVVARMFAIEEALPVRHGVACFNRLYRWTTENVGGAVLAHRFEDPDAMVALDVRFADLYFDAVDAWALGHGIPGAWAPLFERAEHSDISPLRFALAGMNAHISRDLAVAVAEWEDRPPHEDTAHYRDYLVINAVLESTSDEVRSRILPHVLQVMDTEMGELDDVAVLHVIAGARKVSWEVAQLLYRVREHGLLWRAGLEWLDRSVGAASRVLLVDPEMPSFPTYGHSLREKLGFA